MGIFDDILGKKDDKTPAAKPDFGGRLQTLDVGRKIGCLS